ncbi:MAG: U32 family peptidase, partial [Clostridia bacterium]|nr:U32 family peptidase [Clostridia bacterium]
MQKPTLLLPAGNMETFRTALRFGADAVYCGMDQFSLRAGADNFGPEKLASAIQTAHDMGKKVHITLNIFARDRDIPGMLRAAHIARELGADALIVSDLGMISKIAKEVPGIDIHVSTQANTTNAETARIYRSLGAVRIVAARELSLDELEAMARELDGIIEVESFIHGAQCMSWSGRCMLSAALLGRSANRGDCAQPCRWSYALVERKHPDEPWEILEPDGQGNAILSAHDLCMIEHVPRLMQSGIACFKVEGRMKNELYVATIGLAYRRMMDASWAGQTPGPALTRECLDEVMKVSHRDYDTGFYFGQPQTPGMAAGTRQSAEFMARVLDVSGGIALLEMRNRFFAG